jgi:hypothetical protein
MTMSEDNVVGGAVEKIEPQAADICLTCGRLLDTPRPERGMSALLGMLGLPARWRALIGGQAPLSTQNKRRKQMNKKMKIVVIGGSGLIGTKVVNNLRQQGHAVVAASPFSGATR